MNNKLYVYDMGDKWSNPITLNQLKEVFTDNCKDYGSDFDSWFYDMIKNDLVKEL